MIESQTVSVGGFEFRFMQPSFGQRLKMIRIIETAQAGKANADVVETMVNLVNGLKEPDEKQDWTELLSWDQGMELLMAVASIGRASEDERKN